MHPQNALLPSPWVNTNQHRNRDNEPPPSSLPVIPVQAQGREEKQDQRASLVVTALSISWSSSPCASVSLGQVLQVWCRPDVTLRYSRVCLLLN